MVAAVGAVVWLVAGLRGAWRRGGCGAGHGLGCAVRWPVSWGQGVRLVACGLAAGCLR